MKKKGFTLIEIISAIVIIGIIALITVPIVIRVIDETKKKSFLVTAEGIVKAACVSLATHKDAYDEYFIENEYITFKFSASEGKEGESIDLINGEKIKLSFDGKSPIGGEVNLYKNGDVEVINLTDGTFYVNKDVDTELSVTKNNDSLTRKELQILAEELQKQSQQFGEKIKNIENKNKEQNLKIKENGENTTTNTTSINNFNQTMLSKTYPVGSIYISTSSMNPSTIFGGTWESYGTGRTLVGVDTGDTNFNSVSKTGGVATSTGNVGATTLTINQIPGHTHTISHTHTTPAKTVSSSGAHTHVTTAKDVNNILYVSGIQMFWQTSGTMSLSGSETSPGIRSLGSNVARENLTFKIPSLSIASSGAHTHTVGAMTTNSQSTTASGSTGGGTSHTHSISISNLQPYITVYMWKRTA